MPQTQTTRSLVDECVAAMTRLAGVAKPRESEWLDLDLSMGQLKAMFVLTANGPTSVGGLGRLLNIAEPSASLLVDKLEERGLVRRASDPTDRRRTLVEATERGQERLRCLQRVRDERLADWLSRLADDDLRALLRGVKAFIAVIEATDAAAQLAGSDA
jgi:DNA-binding MarR family transcriptional regulator